MEPVSRSVQVFLLFLSALHAPTPAFGLSTNPGKGSKSLEKIYYASTDRRHVLISAGASILGFSSIPSDSLAEPPKAEVVDIAAFKAAQSKTASGPASIVPIRDPPPTLSIKGGLNGKSTVKIPRVGYSLYKTAPDSAARCTALALRAGVRHFDVGSQYHSNEYVSIPLKKYLDIGMDVIDFSGEKPELLSLLDSTRESGEKHSLATVSSGLKSSAAPAPAGSAGRRGRREGLFISHKLSNEEQSMSRTDVKRSVKAQIALLGTQYLDMVSVHSPLTDKGRRLETYAALLELRDAGFVKSVGVCNYGVGPLDEIKASGLDLPSINQLELSPFNTHADVTSWCDENKVGVGCGAWSKLSGVDGPQDQWAVISEIAGKKGMTKAQLLVRWSLQKGYVCVPRSAATSKLERVAIAENSYGGVNPEGGGSVITDEEMAIIDGLNIGLKAGKLGRRDGWSDADVTDSSWDPTYFI